MKFKSKKVLYYLLYFFLICLFAFLDISVFTFKPVLPVGDGQYSIIEEEKNTIEYDIVKRGTLVKQISFESVINRENNDIMTINIPITKNIRCSINSIVNTPQDISTEYEVDNFKKGRVLDIETTVTQYIISIDVCSNYFCETYISSLYGNYVKDISNNPQKLITYNKIDGAIVCADFNNYSFDKVKDAFSFKFQLNTLSSNIYNSLKAETIYTIDEFANSFYIEFNCLKKINYNIGTFEYIVNLDKNIVKETEITIIGIVDKYLIIEGNYYLGEKFKKQNYSLSYNLIAQFY